jgi:hypothetical protein
MKLIWNYKIVCIRQLYEHQEGAECYSLEETMVEMLENIWIFSRLKKKLVRLLEETRCQSYRVNPLCETFQ